MAVILSRAESGPYRLRLDIREPLTDINVCTYQ